MMWLALAISAASIGLGIDTVRRYRRTVRVIERLERHYGIER